MKHTRRAGSFFFTLVVLGFYCPLAAGQKKTTVIDSDKALTVAFSPNGRLLAAAGFGKTILIWDARTGNVRHSLEGQKPTSRQSIAFSPDGKTLIGSGDDGIVRLWNIEKGTLERSISGPAGAHFIPSIAISPDGKRLAVGYDNPKAHDNRGSSAVIVVEFKSGNEQWSWTGGKSVCCLAFAPDGKTLAVADGAVHLLNAMTGERIKELRIEDRSALRIAFSPDGKYLAGAGGYWINVGAGTQQKSEAYLWDLHTGKILLKVTDLEPWLRCVAFSPDGKLLATGSAGPIRQNGNRTWVTSQIRLWDAQTRRLLRTIPGELAHTWSLAFSPDGKSLLSCDGKEVALTETLTGLRRLTLTKRTINSSEAAVDLERWWMDLASSDGAHAYRAMGLLAAASEASVPFLNEHLRPVEGQPHRNTSQLIADLNSDEFAERENAQRELEKLQDLAEDQLAKALASKTTPEARRRIEPLLQKLDLLENRERLRAIRAIEVLENIGTSAAKQALQRLAEGVPEAQQTREARASLERLGKLRKPAFLP